MDDMLAMARYKLVRVRQLATLRYARWLMLQRFRPTEVQTSRLYDDVTIQYLPQGNVSRDLYLGHFEHDVMDFIRHYLKPGMTVFDVGANIGIYSLLSARLVCEQGFVHAFEPTPATMDRLKANLALNQFTWVFANELAVTDRAGRAKLHLYEQNAMNSLARQDWVGNAVGQVEIATISLDEYVRVRSIPRVHLLKIDVEGAELFVFKGARNLLSSLNPPVVLCEFADKTARGFGYEANAIRDFLEEFGFRFFRWNLKSQCLVPEPKRPNYKLYANLICMRAT